MRAPFKLQTFRTFFVYVTLSLPTCASASNTRLFIEHCGNQLPLVGVTLSFDKNVNNSKVSDASGSVDISDSCSTVSPRILTNNIIFSNFRSDYKPTPLICESGQWPKEWNVGGVNVDPISHAALASIATIGMGRFKVETTLGEGTWPSSIRISVGEPLTSASNGILHVSVDNQDPTILAHELGHILDDKYKLTTAAYNPGKLYHMLGTCSSDASALHEGWATFFSLWVNYRSDELHPTLNFNCDQRFDHKQTPPLLCDVTGKHCGQGFTCRKTASEWSVASFFWGLVDTEANPNVDPRLRFQQIWASLVGQKADSIQAALPRLLSSGISLQALKSSWNKNFSDPFPVDFDKK